MTTINIILITMGIISVLIVCTLVVSSYILKHMNGTSINRFVRRHIITDEDLD